MLSPVTDLNNALLSYILTGYQGFTSAAGHVGTNSRFDHDISLLIPELWSRMEVEGRDPQNLIKEGSLEKVEDFEYEGRKVLASRLGYRITEIFAFNHLKSIFDEPQAVFREEMLRPEKQDMEAFADGVDNIVEAQKKVALNYFTDNSVEAAIPPLKALLHIMAYGHYEGKEVSDPDIRKLFDKEFVLSSAWYMKRLRKKQAIDVAFLQNRLAYITSFMEEPVNKEYVEGMNLHEMVNEAKQKLEEVQSPEYLEFLKGTIGADPLFRRK